MWFPPWLRNRKRRASPRRRPTFRPTLEALEDRWAPSTLTVQNNLDSGAGSLRAEIAAAKTGDTIVFAPSLGGQTIKLTSGELLSKKSLTIAGPGAGELTVSGGNTSRVFEVATQYTVTLSGMMISNGAGVFAAGATKTIRGLGGGILNQGTLTVSNNTLSGNTAAGFDTEGGGIKNAGTMMVSGSTLSSNSAYYGGGIKNGGALTVSASTLSGNSATYGGGITNSFGTLTVWGSTLSGNSAFGGGFYGGAGTVTISGSTLSGNSAASGGGIYCYGSAAALTVSDGIFSANAPDSIYGFYTDGGGNTFS